MFDVEHIKRYAKERGITQAELAERLHCGRSTLTRVLCGKRALSPSLAARMKELIAAEEDYITAAVPDDVAKQLQEWAEAAHSTIDEVVRRLLAELPKFRK